MRQSVPKKKPRTASRKKTRFVANALAGLPVGDHTDPAVLGLQLRVRIKAGGHSRTWLFRFKWRDEWVRIVIGHLPTMSLADSRERALALRKALDDGIDPRRARPRRAGRPAPLPLSTAPAKAGDCHTVAFLASEFTERYLRPNRKRPEKAEWLLRRDILREWKDRDARTITPREVVDLLDSIVDRGAPVLANRTARILGQMYRFGIQRRIVDSSPVILLTPPGGKEKARKRMLSDDELRTFQRDPEACTRQEKLTHVIMILLLTGVRTGELATARWPEFDFKAKTWSIPDEHHKEDEGHIVPLTDPVIEHLMALRALARSSPWVFPAKHDLSKRATPQELGRRLARCMNRFRNAGIQKFNLHDLRRTCRTGLSRLGVLPHIAERILSHKQRGVEAVYDRWQYLPEKRAALEKWADFLMNLRDNREDRP